MALTLLGAAAASSVLMAQWKGVAGYLQPQILPHCKAPDCIDIAIDRLHPHEKKLLTMTPSFYQKYFSKPDNRVEYLRLRKDDPRHKFLFFSAEYDDAYTVDNDGYTDPARKFKLMKALNEKFDVKFIKIDKYEKICEEIEKASKMGKLAHVLIDAHGSSNEICLSINQGAAGWIRPHSQFTKCFEGLDLAGRVILLGANSGAPQNGDERNNIAQKIANGARRSVIAPIEYSSERVELVKSDDFEVFDRSTKYLGIKNAFKSVFFPKGDPSVESNLFKIFYPFYKNCQSFPKDRIIHPREKIVQDMITASRTAKTSSYLIQPTDSTNPHDALSFCEDDPGQQFLFLSMESDYNGGLNPELSPALFKEISRGYDFKFKVVDSYEKICNEFKEAAKTGKLAHVIINGHGNKNQGIHISGENFLENYLHTGRDLAKCMSGLIPSGKVTFISCNTAEPCNENPDGTYAKSVAKTIQREVIAPDNKSYAHKIEITSVVPFKIKHPVKNDPNGNLYKTFKP